MSNAVATVAFLQGQAWAKAPDGSLRALTVGSVLNDDEVLVTATGSQVQLDFGNGEPILVNGGLEVAMSRDFSADTATDADEALLSDASVQEALTVLEQGGDLLDELEETAAGNNGGGGSDGNTSFVQLTRILEQTDPQSFSYQSPSAEVDAPEQRDGGGFVNNAPPQATDQTLSGNEDEVIRGQIIASDREGDAITYRVTTSPANGSVVLDPVTGQFIFTPNPNYNGSDSFVVTVTDSRGQSTTTTVSLNILPVNDAPTADNISLTTDEDVAVSGQIIASDVDGDTLTYAIGTPPANGTVVLDPVTGAFVFTPNANYHGSDSFVVTITDGNGGTTTSTVTIGVIPVNDAPTATNQNLTTDEGTPLNGSIIASDVDGDTLTYAVTTTASNGTVTIDPATGQFTYTPNANYNGPDSFVVTVSDGKGGTTTSTISIGVNPVNDAPVATNQNLTTDEDTPLNGAIVASDVDGDTLSYTVTTAALNGTVTIDSATGQFTYTPNANYNGPDSFVVTVSDGKGGTTTSTISIGVNPVNDAPTATNQNLTTDEDTPLNGAIVASDVDGDTLSYTVTTAAVNGTVTIDSATGQFTYTPNANYNGPDSFVVTVSDGKGGTTTSTISIGVNPVNDAPTATNQNLTTDEDTPLNGAIVASDVDGDTLSYTVTTAAANGTVTIDSTTGQFTYTPNANYNGPDSFVVTVSDGKGGTTTSTISIGVNPVNDAPTATNQNLTTDEDTPLNGAIVASDVDGDTLTYAVTTTASNGTVTIDPATGQFTYTPNVNYNGPDSFVVTVSDGKGGTTTSTISIGVNPVNDAPVATNQNLTTDEDTPLNGAIVASDVDGDTLSYTVTTAAVNGTVTIDSTTGQFTYTPNANYNGPDSFVVTVSDGKGGTTTSTISIGVNPVNDAPTATNQNLTTDEDTPLNGAIVASDVDGDTLSYTVTTAALNGTVTIDSATGQFTYTPNANYNGPDSFVVTVSDGKGGTTTSTISIGVNPVNDAPVATNQNLTTDEDTPLNGAIVASDVDGDTLSYTVTTAALNGTVTIDSATGQFTYTPNANYNGPDSFVVTVSDGKGGTTTSTISIDVNPVNDAPVATNQNLTTDEDTPLNGAIVASDVDGDTLSYTVTTAAANGTVTIDSATGQFTYTPNANYNGPDSFVVTVSDGKGGTTTSTISIGVNPVNDAPIATNQNLTTDEDTPLNGAIVASDVDGDTLSYTVTTAAVNGTVTIDSATGQFTYTPNANYNGPDSFVVTVSDGKGGTTTSTISIGVNPVNDAPVATNQNLTTDEDTPLNGAIVASDVDGDTLSYTVTTAALNGTVTIDSATGQFTYTPNANYNGPDSFVVTVSDGKGGTTTSTISIGVNPVNDAPTATNQNLTTDEDTPLNGAIVASDVDGDTLSYTVTTAAANGTVTIDSATGQFTYTPNANYNGPDSFVVTVSDGKGGTTTSTISIGVTPVNDNPVANDDTASVYQNTTLTLTAAQLLANDYDVDGDTLSITAVQPGTNGTVALVGGSVLFTPTAGYHGPASFTYTVSDGKGGSSTGTVNVTVVKPNTPPDAVDDPTGVPYSIALGDASASDLWTNLDSKGKMIHIGAFKATGEAGALYQGTVDGNTNVLGVKDSPRPSGYVPNQIEYDTATGKSESIVLTFNGNLNRATFGVSRLYPGEEGGEIGLWEAYYNGVLVASSTFRLFGTVEHGSFTIDTGNIAFNSIRFSALHTNDGTGDGGDYFLTSFSGTGPASINGNLSIVSNTSNTINASVLLANDTDADGDALTIIGVNNVTHGVASVVNGNVVFTPTAGYVGPASFTYTVSDNRGGTDTATVNLMVNPANQAPVAVADVRATGIGSAINISTASLLANDLDPDDSGTNKDGIFVFSVQDAVNGTVSLSDSTVRFTPIANFEGQASFTYTIRDSKGGTSTATVNIGVGAASAPSVVVSKSLLAIAQGTGGTSVKFPIITKLVDTDGSESLSIKISNVPTSLSFNAGVNLGGGVWQFTEADLPNLMLNLPGSYTANAQNLTVQVTSTEINGGFAASTSTVVTLKAAYTTVNVTTTESGGYMGTSASEFIQGGSGNNTIDGGNGNNVIHGGAGNDTLTTGSGSDIIYGGSGNDIINAGSGTDRIYGGSGNDLMRGGDAGENFVDVFVWELGDQGAAGAPAVDTIQFFSTAAAGNNGTGGDVLDLRDLLQGESVGPNNSAGNLADYLHFAVSGGNTIIHISHTGGFGADSHNVGSSFTSTAETQRIVLEGVNLQSTYAGATTDQQIITQLLNNNKLITD